MLRAGVGVPIDGVLVGGNSTLSTGSLTGESMPRAVSAGENVISGCVNLDGLLKVRTTKEFEDSTVSKILDLVENSTMKKSKAGHWDWRLLCLLFLWSWEGMRHGLHGS